MLNIAICDDSHGDMTRLENHISQYMKDKLHTLTTYSDSESLLNDLAEKPFNIIFMDIVIHEANGIEITSKINQLQPDAQVIYQSSNMGFFRNVYKTNHIYFLLKPVEYMDFSRAIEKAVKNLERLYIVIENKEKFKCGDIIYIELINHDMVFYFKNGDFVSVRAKTKELLKLLPSQFVRCHKSFIVNIDCISSYNSKKSIKVENEQVLPIGKKFADDVDKTIIKYWRDSII